MQRRTLQRSVKQNSLIQIDEGGTGDGLLSNDLHREAYVHTKNKNAFPRHM
jgi:hypothetical protein